MEVDVSRAMVIVLDGVGVGGAPDAAAFGDEGSDTLGNLARAVGGLRLPALASLGLGNLHAVAGVPPAAAPRAGWGRMQEVSAGKDSTTGHWELMGVVTREPFPTYPDGFPADLLAAFTARTGWGVIGNRAASGTAIIAELGAEHIATRRLIVYTSADSVFQIAAHVDVCPLPELYRVCAEARDLLAPPHAVSRVIARPFAGGPRQFARTPDRRDFSLPPPEGLLLTRLQAAGVTVRSIGKIRDLYAGVGIDAGVPSKSNDEGMAALDAAHAAPAAGPELILLNLVDFDMLWGHRNDPAGMRDGLEACDRWLGGFLARQRPGELLLLTADHGNDPTTPSTDHSREQVPLLAHLAGGRRPGADLGLRRGFVDVAATLAEFFACPWDGPGASFLPELREEDRDG